VTTENRADWDPLHAELSSFDRYMAEVKGLAQNTRQQRIYIIRRFLNVSVRSSHLDWMRVCNRCPLVFKRTPVEWV